MTLNCNNYGKRSNLNTIIGVKSSNDNDLILATYKNKLSNKELAQQQKITKVTKKEGIRSKSNKRTNKEIFERVYMQSPMKLINRKPLNQTKLKKNINTYESEVIIKEKLAQLRDRSISPNIPKIKEAISKESRHKTAIKKRSEQDLSKSMKNDNSSISTSKDHSKLNFIGLKNIKDNELDLTKGKGDHSMNHSGIVENCSSVTTIKRSKAIEQNNKSFGDKTSTNNQRIKEMSNQIAESLNATQAKLAKIKNIPNSIIQNNIEIGLNKSDNLIKQKKKSKEELKHLSAAQLQSKGSVQKKLQNGINRKATVESFIANDASFPKDSSESSVVYKQHKKK